MRPTANLNTIRLFSICLVMLVWLEFAARPDLRHKSNKQVANQYYGKILTHEPVQ